MILRRLLVPVIAVAWLLLLAASASATAPQRFSYPEDGSVPDFAQCDGFHISLSTTGSTTGTLFLDSQGGFARLLLHTQVRDTFTNSATGKTVVNRGEFDEIFTPIGTDEVTHVLVGHTFMGTSPGEGVVLQDVGRMVYSPTDGQIVVSAGQHHVPDDTDPALFCAALA